ncbi:hypothetical protein GF318_03005 [Candidatus Micrarchaeota archaeon]|nr:hypothetical protein [Candidatus Micrarchaeota archaeon]
MRGQYFSFDAIIASVIFVLALVALLSYWHSVRSFLDYQNDQLSRDAVRISNLMFTPPEPSADCATMERLGFAKGWDDRRVDSSVISCAASQDAAWLRNVTGSSYGVYLKITNLANGTETEIGTDPSTEPDVADVVKLRRLATVVDSPDDSTYLASFDLSMYKKSQ